MTIDNSAIGDNADPVDEGYQLISGEAPPESIEQFIEGLNADWEYPVDTHLGDVAPDNSTTQEPEQEEVDDPDDPLIPEPDATADPNAPSATSDEPATVEVNGVQVPLADVQRLYEFDQFLRSNPEASRRVAAAISDDQPAPAEPTTGEPAVPAQAAAPATPIPVAPPDFLDLEDPAQKFLWDSHVATQTQLANMVKANNDQAQTLANRQATIDAEAAISQFRTAHPNFNDDQMNTLRRHAAGMGILDSIIATSPDAVTALSRTLDLAALDHADSRTLYLAPPETARAKTTTEKSRARKSALNSLGGSSGSVPKTSTTPKPKTDRQAIDEFARQLGESFGQTN